MALIVHITVILLQLTIIHYIDVPYHRHKKLNLQLQTFILLDRKLIIGTRGSELALAQVELVFKSLIPAVADLLVEYFVERDWRANAPL